MGRGLYKCIRTNFNKHSGLCTYFNDMLSIPTATPREISPDWIACAILRIDCRPDEQSRLTVEMGIEAGMPAARAAAREIYSGEGG